MKPIVAMPSCHYATFLCEEAKQKLLEAGFELVGNDTGRRLDRDEQKALIADAYAVIAGTEKYDADMIEAAKNLKVIVRYGVGTDNLDLNAMRERGIAVGIISNCNAVAEFAVTLMLDILKPIPAYNSAVRSANWVRLPMRELSGKTIGLLGFGRIGQRVAKLLSGFDVKVIAYDPFFNEKAAAELNVTAADQDTVLADSDIVSLHLPMTEENEHLINRETITRMKDGAYLVNTARGPLVDEMAVKEALDSGKLSGFATDVYETEPVTERYLLRNEEKTVFTPHTAALSFETNYNGGVICADSILAVANGGAPLYPVH